MPAESECSVTPTAEAVVTYSVALWHIVVADYCGCCDILQVVAAILVVQMWILHLVYRCVSWCALYGQLSM